MLRLFWLCGCAFRFTSISGMPRCIFKCFTSIVYVEFVFLVPDSAHPRLPDPNHAERAAARERELAKRHGPYEAKREQFATTKANTRADSAKATRSAPALQKKPREKPWPEKENAAARGWCLARPSRLMAFGIALKRIVGISSRICIILCFGLRLSLLLRWALRAYNCGDRIHRSAAPS